MRTKKKGKGSITFFLGVGALASITYFTGDLQDKVRDIPYLLGTQSYGWAQYHQGMKVSVSEYFEDKNEAKKIIDWCINLHDLDWDFGKRFYKLGNGNYCFNALNGSIEVKKGILGTNIINVSKKMDGICDADVFGDVGAVARVYGFNPVKNGISLQEALSSLVKQSVRQRRHYSNLEGRVDKREASARNFENMVKEAYTPLLGERTTNNILDVAKDPNISPDDAAKKIIGDIPTGLSSREDTFVKGVVKGILDRSEITK